MKWSSLMVILDTYFVRIVILYFFRVKLGTSRLTQGVTSMEASTLRVAKFVDKLLWDKKLNVLKMSNAF